MNQALLIAIEILAAIGIVYLLYRLYKKVSAPKPGGRINSGGGRPTPKKRP